jgi:regulator of cell morphogenesis and NO signaling
MTITPQSTVADVAATIPASLRVLERHGIDLCGGGPRTLQAECERRGISAAAVVEAIGKAAVAPAAVGRDWRGVPPRALMAHIVRECHPVLRAELPRLAAMAAKVAGVHGERVRCMRRVDVLVRALKAALTSHLWKEEQVLFPAIAALDRGGWAPSVVAPIAAMEHEHDDAGHQLQELRDITGGYTLPTWACGTFRALYQGLDELEATVQELIHLEHDVLFPAAATLAEARATRRGGDPISAAVDPRAARRR